jgi:hypothetical protein
MGGNTEKLVRLRDRWLWAPVLKVEEDVSNIYVASCLCSVPLEMIASETS